MIWGDEDQGAWEVQVSKPGLQRRGRRVGAWPCAGVWRGAQMFAQMWYDFLERAGTATQGRVSVWSGWEELVLGARGPGSPVADSQGCHTLLGLQTRPPQSPSPGRASTLARHRPWPRRSLRAQEEAPSQGVTLGRRTHLPCPEPIPLRTEEYIG